MSVGFAERVLPGQRAAYVQKIRAEGLPEFVWRPTREGSEYFPVRFFEPRSPVKPSWEGHDFLPSQRIGKRWRKLALRAGTLPPARSP